MRVIAIANPRRGSGKTTVAYNLAVQLEKKGNTVLLIDADPQARLTRACGIEAEYDFSPTIWELIVKEDLQDDYLAAAPYQLSDRISIIAANIRLSTAESGILGGMGQELKMANVIRRLNADYVIIDCPSSLSYLTVTSIAAANIIIIPWRPIAGESVGVKSTMWIAEKILQRVSRKSAECVVLPFGIQPRTKKSKWEKQLETELPDAKRFNCNIAKKKICIDGVEESDMQTKEILRSDEAYAYVAEEIMSKGW